MCRKKHLVTKEEIETFNGMRQTLVGREFTRIQIQQKLQSIGYSANDTFLKALSDGVNPPILRVKRGAYCVNPKPVFIDRLQTAWNTYAKYSNPDATNIKIQAAIALLKNEGYRILKPSYQEV